MKTTRAKTLLSLLGLFMMTGCTKTAVERQVGSENTYNVTGTAACMWLCAPDREDVYLAMHQECRWPAVPAILVRGSEKNGFIGVPHTVWRFTCLTVDTETNVAELVAEGD